MGTAVKKTKEKNEDIWGVKEVAKHLNLSEKTVYVLARSGDLPCKIIGKNFRFSREKIERFV